MRVWCGAQVAPKEILYPRNGLSSITARHLAHPPVPLQATAVKHGSEFPEPGDALQKLENLVSSCDHPCCYVQAVWNLKCDWCVNNSYTPF